MTLEPLAILARRATCAACFALALLGATPTLAQHATPAPLYVEGYTDRLSYAPGETVGFCVSTSAPTYSMRILRLGAEDELVREIDGVEGTAHAIPENASSRGCGWPVSHRLEVPDDWQSGYYHVELRVEDRGGQFVHRNRRTAEGSLFFIVRPRAPGERTKILLELSTNTYNAYTNWGGHSLYSYHDQNGLQGHRVSFDRPLTSQYEKWERHFVRWAEREGFVLDYAANDDLARHREMLDAYRLVVSVGHDEYWSKGMRDALESFIGEGGNVAFLSGNTCCWQVRPEDDGRALTCWKQAYIFDPLFRSEDHSTLSTLWSHHLVERPENSLTGVGFLHGGYHRSHGQFMDGPGSFEVHRPDHWVFEGADVERGDRIGGADSIVGYECDGCELAWRDGLPFATGRDGTPDSFVVLGTCPARWAPGDCFWYDRFPKDRVGAAVMGIYRRGGVVFTAGTTDWAHGLRGRDARIERITKNLLERLSR